MANTEFNTRQHGNEIKKLSLTDTKTIFADKLRNYPLYQILFDYLFTVIPKKIIEKLGARESNHYWSLLKENPKIEQAFEFGFSGQNPETTFKHFSFTDLINFSIPELVPCIKQSIPRHIVGKIFKLSFKADNYRAMPNPGSFWIKFLPKLRENTILNKEEKTLSTKMFLMLAYEKSIKELIINEVKKILNHFESSCICGPYETFNIIGESLEIIFFLAGLKAGVQEAEIAQIENENTLFRIKTIFCLRDWAFEKKSRPACLRINLLEILFKQGIPAFDKTISLMYTETPEVIFSDFGRIFGSENREIQMANTCEIHDIQDACKTKKQIERYLKSFNENKIEPIIREEVYLAVSRKTIPISHEIIKAIPSELEFLNGVSLSITPYREEHRYHVVYKLPTQTKRAVIHVQSLIQRIVYQDFSDTSAKCKTFNATAIFSKKILRQFIAYQEAIEKNNLELHLRKIFPEFPKEIKALCEKAQESVGKKFRKMEEKL